MMFMHTGFGIRSLKISPALQSGAMVRLLVVGFDVYSRLMARHLGKYIAGNPTVIVDNMTGAGSLIAASHVYKSSEARWSDYRELDWDPGDGAGSGTQRDRDRCAIQGDTGINFFLSCRQNRDR